MAEEDLKALKVLRVHRDRRDHKARRVVEAEAVMEDLVQVLPPQVHRPVRPQVPLVRLDLAIILVLVEAVAHIRTWT